MLIVARNTRLNWQMMNYILQECFMVEHNVELTRTIFAMHGIELKTEKPN